jgi:ubiquinone/menaquinone biosynthesis C-methylase UbiE
VSPKDRSRAALDQREYFNRMVDVFDVPQEAEVIERLSRIVAAAAIRPGDVVVDVGSGVGVLIPLIDPFRPASVFACDLAENMLLRLHRHYPHVHCLQSDAAALPLRSASADVIFMNAMYGNIGDKPGACRNAARILRPGGRFIISHPEGAAFVSRLRASTGLFVESLPPRDEFDALVNPMGLEVREYLDEQKLYLTVAVKR